MRVPNPCSDPARFFFRGVVVALVAWGAVSPAPIDAQRAGRKRPTSAVAAALESNPSIRIVPLQGDRSTPPAETSAATNMTYHGGNVQHVQKVFTIFWSPSSGAQFPVGYQTTINQFVGDLSGSALQALATQYTDGGGHISSTVTFGGTWLDTNPANTMSNPVTQNDLSAEVARAKVANPSWTDDGNTYYQVYTPPGNGTTETYCGYHVLNNPAYGVVLYPASHFPFGTCLIGGTYPNSAQIDGAISTTSVELLETVTDPLGTGWYYLDNSTGEIGALCNSTFGTRSGVDGSNMTINGHPYLAQQEWSNAVSGCSLAGAGILAGASSITSESIPNGWLDPGEAASVSLCMDNFNPATSGSITGTLQASGGVTSPSGAQSYGTIAAFGSTCHTYSFTVGASCGSQVTATLQDLESGGPTKNLAYTFQVGGPGAAFSSQNFDGAVVPNLPAGWTTSTFAGTSNLFVTAAGGSDSAPNHAFADDPPTASDNMLVSPTIAIPASGGRLSFRHSFNLDFDSQGYYDGGLLEISINGADFADIVTAGGSFLAGAYTNVLTSGSGNTSGGRSAWAGNSSGYITSTVALPPAAAGQNVQLRWRLTTDDSVGFTGWLIDTIAFSWFQCGGITTPAVVTQAATSVTSTTATLNGTVNPNGNTASALFDYGLTTFYGSQMAATPPPGSGSSPVSVSAAISGLTCNTLYHFRAAATNSGGPTNGGDLTLTTAACSTSPIVLTKAATSITLTGATLNATVNPNALNTTALFDYGATTGYGTQIAASPAPGSGSSPVAVSAPITGLTCGNVVHYRISATNSGGTTTGVDFSFTAGTFFSESFDGVVAPALPAGWSTSTLSGASNAWLTNATASDTAPNHAVALDLASVSDSVLVSPTIAVPAGNTRLSFQHYYNTEDGFDGGVLEISVSGAPFQDIIAAGGSFVGGGYNGTLPSGNPIAGRQAWTGDSGGYISTTITMPPVAAGQSVVLRWRMTSDTSVAVSGWSVDGIALYQFLCASTPPTVTTLGATNVTATHATLNGTINPNGTATTGVFNWGETGNYGNQVATTPAPGSGSSPVAVTASLTGLTCGTLYHFRTSASNSGGPNNGSDLTFSTPACPPGGNYVQNGTFGSGLTNWQTFSTPDSSYITAGVSSGVMEFTRKPPPPGTSNQATVFQETGVGLPIGAPVMAQFDLGNTSTVRKYIKVLLIQFDFSDFAACTFWLPPSSPLQTYQLKTHTNKTWTNAAIYFYAGTSNGVSDTGAYQVDNVSVQYAPAQAIDHTDCVDPLVPMAPGGAPGANLVTNGDFGTNALSPWTTFGTVTAQASNGFLEMIRPSSTLPAGVVLQPTNQGEPLGTILTSSFQLGNSSGVTKRVTAIMHDLDFTDLVACVFWLTPGQALSNYSMVGWTSKAWGNVTMSFYPATIGPDQWTKVDNVVYRTTPATSTTGSTCNEPPPASGVQPDPRGESQSVRLSAGSSAVSNTAQAPALSSASYQALGAARTSSASRWVGDGGFAPSANGASWEAVADATGTTTLAWPEAVDLRQARAARLTFASWLTSIGSQAAVQVSTDGMNWTTISAVPASDDWQRVDVDLGAFAGEVVHVQLVFEGIASVDAAKPDAWQVDDLHVEIE